MSLDWWEMYRIAGPASLGGREYRRSSDTLYTTAWIPGSVSTTYVVQYFAG